MVAMQDLSVRRRLLWIECSWICDDLAADRKAALLLDRQRFELALAGLSRFVSAYVFSQQQSSFSR